VQSQKEAWVAGIFPRQQVRAFLLSPSKVGIDRRLIPVGQRLDYGRTHPGSRKGLWCCRKDKGRIAEALHQGC
jgi:hypothetical protein